MGLYRRGKIYWFRITHQGKRIQASLDTDNKKLAEKIYARKLTDIIEGRYFKLARTRNISFNDMKIKYLAEHEKLRDSTSLKALSVFFARFMVSQISVRHVSEYRQMRSKSVKPATIYQELALLRRMFNVAIKEWEWLDSNPVSKLSFSVGNRNARTRWLTSDEEQALIACCTNPHWLKNLVIFALHTGMRRGEILNLEHQHVNFFNRSITVMSSKNGDKRVIPMSNTIYDMLINMKVIDIQGKVFPISKSSVRHAFDDAVAKAELKDFHFHDLRHTFATRLVQNGVDLYRVKELLGHKTIAMTMRYAHHYPESLRSSIEVLDRCYNSATIVYNKKVEAVNCL